MESKMIKMKDPGQLRYVLKLLDDDSDIVRRAISEELSAYGPNLEDSLAQLDEPPSQEERRQIHNLLEAYRRDHLKESWPAWMHLPSDREKLEGALTILSEFLSGYQNAIDLKTLLDRLADEYRTLHGTGDPEKLAKFLFQGKQLKGAQEDYYNPMNSNLIAVIEEKQGIPISLACIYILVGTRLGLKIDGCNFPGHFLARTFIMDEMVLVDCFNGGRFIPKKAFDQAKSSQILQTILHQPADAEAIVVRVLNNLIHAYRKNVHEENCRLMTELRGSLLEGSEKTDQETPFDD